MISDRAWIRWLRATVFAVAGGVFSTSLAWAAPNPPAQADWPQAHSDIAADPAIRFGILPNGMRYEIMKNATPKGVVSIRFRIGAGSLNESDAQQGLAHFLEHMAFRGSAHVPEAEVWQDLQRLGLTVGADANAFTEATQTTYQFDLPKNDPATVASGLLRMRETASELTLAQTTMDAERGVVLSEERAGDVATYHMQKAQVAFLLKDQRLPNRLPIGQTDVIQHAPVSLIADFYHAYYRPERATLIVVGDIDVDAIEAQIKARFSDWKPVGAAGTDPVLGPPLARPAQTKLFVEAGIPPQITMAWVKPYEASVDTEASERRDFVELIGLVAFDLRLQSMPQRPFISAGALPQDLAHSAKLILFTITPDPNHIEASFVAAETVRRQVVQYGLRQDEVDRVVAVLQARFETLAAGAATRPSPEVAKELLRVVDTGKEIATSPKQDLAAYGKLTDGLKADEVTAALRQAFATGGPLVFVASPTPIDGGEASLGEALKTADAAPITAPVADAKIAWPYTSFGAPGRVVAEREIADLGTTQITFANGVRLAVKPTTFAAGQVLVKVSFGDGILGEPKAEQSPRWANAVFIGGGLKAISYFDMYRALSSRTQLTTLEWGDDHFALNGQTTTTDLETQMQVLAAYITAPRWPPESFDRARTAYLDQLPKFDQSPAGVLQRELARRIRGGDLRWANADAADAASARIEDLKGRLSPALESSPIAVTIVGDLTVDQAIAATASTFGALPPRPTTFAIPEGARDVSFPSATATPVALHHKGRADDAGVLLAWPVPDFYSDRKRARDVKILERIINHRLLEQLRIADGAAYLPQTAAESSQVFNGYGYLLAYAEVPLTKVTLFYDTLAKIVADLAANPVSADELERARGPWVEQREQEQKTNAYWLSQIATAQIDPRNLDAIRTTIPDFNQVTAADVQRVARTYLKDATAWKLEILPQVIEPSPPR